MEYDEYTEEMERLDNIIKSVEDEKAVLKQSRIKHLSKWKVGTKLKVVHKDYPTVEIKVEIISTWLTTKAKFVRYYCSVDYNDLKPFSWKASADVRNLRVSNFKSIVEYD